MTRETKSTHFIYLPRDLIHKGNRSSDMIEHLDVSYLLPRHGHVFQQFQDCVRCIFESAKINTFVLTKSFARHISVVTNNFTQMISWELRLNWGFISKSAFLRIPLAIAFLPLSCLGFQGNLRERTMGKKGISIQAHEFPDADSRLQTAMVKRKNRR